MRTVHGDLTGKTFSRWTVLARSPQKSKVALYECRCSCGAIKIVRAPHLYNKASRSCGCLQPESVRTHGKSKTPIYLVWRNLKCRCLVPTNPDYPDYGGRGITIHPAWAESFEEFYSYVGDPPSPKHKIDRIDNNGNYEPGNIRWSTQKQQAANRRSTKFYVADGVKTPISEIADKYGIETNALAYRLLVKKMTLHDAVSTPMRKYTKKASKQFPQVDRITR